MRKIRIGTRGSLLALKQAQMVSEEIKRRIPYTETEIIVISTKGDKITDRPLLSIGGKGLFINEFEAALENNEIDVAVHSGKDMPSSLKPQFDVPAVLKRGNPADVIITNTKSDINSISQPVIGTGSPRRKIMIKSLMPNCRVDGIRGNVPTRIEKLNCGFDAVILSAAAIEKLDIKNPDLNIVPFSTETFIPAAAQAIIACETLKNSEAAEIIKKINHSGTMAAFKYERKIMELIGADCHAPAGAYISENNGLYSIRAFFNTSKIVKRLCSKTDIDQEIKNVALELMKC